MSSAAAAGAFLLNSLAATCRFAIFAIVETGGQLHAVQALVAQSQATLVGTAVIVDGLYDRGVRRSLGLRSLINVRQLRT